MPITALLPLLCLGFSLTIHAQTAFTWVDEQGVLHFSDTPDNSNATTVELPEFQLTPSEHTELPEQAVDELLVEVASEESQSSLDSQPEPLTLTMNEPSHDQVIHNNAGNITVKATVNRPLLPGEQLQLLLDGKPYHAPTTSPIWQLKNIDRGSHQLSIEVTQSGKKIALSPSITVHLQRATLKRQKPSIKAD